MFFSGTYQKTVLQQCGRFQNRTKSAAALRNTLSMPFLSFQRSTLDCAPIRRPRPRSDGDADRVREAVRSQSTHLWFVFRQDDPQTAAPAAGASVFVVDWMSEWTEDDWFDWRGGEGGRDF